MIQTLKSGNDNDLKISFNLGKSNQLEKLAFYVAQPHNT